MAAETVRFAPSPTGWLHLGHAYSAWFADQQRDGGKFLLRIEDIDSARTRPEYVQGIFEDLAWLGIRWEEPPMFQSERSSAYIQALTQLKDLGVVYPCFCSRAEISNALGAPHSAEPHYPGTCRKLTPSESQEKIASGAAYAYRLDLSRAEALTGPLEWTDRRRGRQTVPFYALSDPVLSRKDAPTSYHLSSVTDDAESGVSLVTRGSELFVSTHIHRIIQALLGFPTPEYEHHPLVGDAFGNRLAKRDSAISLRSLRTAGISPGEVIAKARGQLIEGS